MQKNAAEVRNLMVMPPFDPPQGAITKWAPVPVACSIVPFTTLHKAAASGCLTALEISDRNLSDGRGSDRAALISQGLPSRERKRAEGIPQNGEALGRCRLSGKAQSGEFGRISHGTLCVA
jgi:hypothetical protein